ncbi:MAG: DNA mismatch repair endonuclease MutL [Lachnospiraceae bacterium]
MIKILDQATINKIAAGEVVERPSSVVKELVENAIDAGASAITVEIKDGGISFIRITDNGGGIEKEEVPTAFIRHATSKIMTIEDLMKVSSLGFRGEALASIAAVAQVECITKTVQALTGIRYEIHGTKEIAKEEIGAPTGTTIIVRNLFYNVPARKKFLKTAQTEGGYVTDLMVKMALSHPDISFKYIVNGSNKIATSGNGKLQDVIYHIYGKDVSSNLLPIKREVGEFSIEGYIGKAYVSKGNRGFEHYFINGRSIKSNIVNKAIEEGYKSYVMIHKFPFTALHLTLNPDKLDVNVHPQKMEFKYADSEQLFQFVKESIRKTLLSDEMIQDVSLRSEKEQKNILIEQQKKQVSHVPEPFEKHALSMRQQKQAGSVSHNEKEEKEKEKLPFNTGFQKTIEFEDKKQPVSREYKSEREQPSVVTQENYKEPSHAQAVAYEKEPTGVHTDVSEKEAVQAHVEEATDKHTEEQMSFPVERFISKEARRKHRLIGQVFGTYWMIEYEGKLYIVDQHAAHEKVMFERLMKQMSEKNVISQQILPPKVLHLDSVEHTMVMSHMDLFTQTGFEIEDFGDDSIVLRAMPDDIMGVDPELLFDELLNALTQDIGTISMDFFVEKLSGMACKAAIKGNTTISTMEADALIDEMLSLENPYNCPHGRPTTISISQYELERKFKRIQDK